MSPNPVSRVRTFGSLALVLVSLLAIGVLFATDASSTPWIIAIVLTSVVFALASFFVNLRHPEASDQAWDEMNTTAHRSSLVFGYYAALAVYAVFFTAIYLAELDPALAYYWMGPVLGLAPALHFLTSVARGTAE